METDLYYLMLKVSSFLLLSVLGCAGLSKGLCDVLPPISFLLPGGVSREPQERAPLKVIIEPGFIAYDNRPLPPSEVVAYLNGVLQSEKATSFAVYIRQGLTFGEVVRALDELRRTEAKAIGVSMIELKSGQTL